MNSRHIERGENTQRK